MAAPYRLLAVVLALSVASGCASGSKPRASSPATGAGVGTVSTTPGLSSSAPAITTSTTQPPVTTTVDPGLLPQTTAEPDSGEALDASVRVLWSAIVAGTPDAALSVFFPQTAYVRMKTGVIPNPAGDYVDRLVAFYRLDIEAYHAYLGSGAAGARLIGVDGDIAYASWIPPGYCENLIGYWHLPGVRLVYSEAGVVNSFAVASLISWHSVWYVVHLGPNPRPSDVGTVDQPASGPGTPGPPGGC
jgi:hypothetical protein